jgi:hypothetical protein
MKQGDRVKFKNSFGHWITGTISAIENGPMPIKVKPDPDQVSGHRTKIALKESRVVLL